MQQFPHVAKRRVHRHPRGNFITNVTRNIVFAENGLTGFGPRHRPCVIIQLNCNRVFTVQHSFSFLPSPFNSARLNHLIQYLINETKLCSRTVVVVDVVLVVHRYASQSVCHFSIVFRDFSASCRFYYWQSLTCSGRSLSQKAT